MIENTKAFYCSGWKEGCKYTLWKSVLEPYGAQLDENLVTLLLKDKEIKDYPLENKVGEVKRLHLQLSDRGELKVTPL